MKKLRTKLYWIIPLLITVISIGILYFVNLERFTAPPHEKWSKSLQIATMDSYYNPQVAIDSDNIHLYYSEDHQLIHKQFDQDYRITKEETIDTTGTWDDFYVYQNEAILYKDGILIDASSNTEIDEADTFHRGVGEIVYYTKGQDVYTYNAATKKTEKLFTVSHEVEKISATDQLLLVYSKNLNKGVYSIYEQKDANQYELILTENIDVGISNMINQIEFTSNDNQVFFAVTAETQSSSGKKYYFYYSTIDLENPTVDLVRFIPTDPETEAPLQDISDIQLRTIGDQLQILFSSVGFTFTDTNDHYAMNVYSMTLGDNDDFDIVRHSNTYTLSLQPMFFGGEAVIWKERAGSSKYNLYLASTKPNIKKEANKTTGDEHLITLGITLSNVATSFLVLMFILVWLIVPIAYLFLSQWILRRRGRSRDINTNEKVFQIGVILYVVNALLLRSLLFPENAYPLAPSYITFPYSSFVYIIGFALLAYVSVQLIKRDWGTIGKYSYFIGIQLLCYTLILGPFYF